MVTEVDHHVIKTRIKEIIQADSNVYDSTGRQGKLVDVFVGRPYNNSLTAHPNPFLFITNADNLEEAEAQGVVQNNIIKATLHRCHYILVIVDIAQDGREVEKSLDNLQKLVLQSIKTKFELRKPTDSSDPLCNYSFPERVRVFNAGDDGKPIQGREIHFRVDVVTA
tara:strand:+ start:1482 stop:1982 length:501 start_codon:yes stop_codon:yes gene_type:complete